MVLKVRAKQLTEKDVLHELSEGKIALPCRGDSGKLKCHAIKLNVTNSTLSPLDFRLSPERRGSFRDGGLSRRGAPQNGPRTDRTPRGD